MPVKPASSITQWRRVLGHGWKTHLRAGLYARMSAHQQTLSSQRRAIRDTPPGARGAPAAAP